MEKSFRKNWMMGFLGFMSILGVRYFQTGEWLYLVWFSWALWFTWFLPVSSEVYRDEKVMIK